MARALGNDVRRLLRRKIGRLTLKNSAAGEFISVDPRNALAVYQRGEDGLVSADEIEYTARRRKADLACVAVL